MLPYARCKEFIADLTGHVKATGSLSNFQKECVIRIEGYEQEIKKQLLQSPILPANEIGIGFNGKIFWMHVISNKSISYFAHHLNRGRKPMQKESIIGVSLDLIGMYLLVSQKEIATAEGSILGVFMIFTCVLSWSYRSLFVSKADLPKNFFVSTGYQMLTAGTILFIGSLIFKEIWVSPFDWSHEVVLSMLFLVFFGGIVAFTSFNYLLKSVSTEKVATSAYLNPIIAMLLG
jgi:hypothetical protein